MADGSISDLHYRLNAPRFNELKHFRRNSVLYRVVAPVNCLLGCVLSNNVEMVPVLVQRCKSEIAAVEATVTTDEEAVLKADYLDLALSYLREVEARFGRPE